VKVVFRAKNGFGGYQERAAYVYWLNEKIIGTELE
jgi:hypothetical protein